MITRQQLLPDRFQYFCNVSGNVYVYSGQLGKAYSFSPPVNIGRWKLKKFKPKKKDEVFQPAY